MAVFGFDPLTLSTAGNPVALVSRTRSTVRRVGNAVTINDVLPMAGGAIVARSRFAMILLGTFAGVALALALVGIYSVISYSVGQHKQEIGVRMAWGAEPRKILRLVIGQGMAQALGGIVARILIAATLTRFQASLLFGIDSADPLTYAELSSGRRATASAAAPMPDVGARRDARLSLSRVLPGGVAALIAILWAVTTLRPVLEVPEVTTRTQLTGRDIVVTSGWRLAISQDGSWIVVGDIDEGGVFKLYARRSDALEFRELSGTEGATDPAFSPDGEWVAFRAQGTIKKVSLLGGPALPIADGVHPHWGVDDTIVFFRSGSLYMVSAAYLPPGASPPSSWRVTRPWLPCVLTCMRPSGGPARQLGDVNA